MALPWHPSLLPLPKLLLFHRDQNTNSSSEGVDLSSVFSILFSHSPICNNPYVTQALDPSTELSMLCLNTVSPRRRRSTPGLRRSVYCFWLDSMMASWLWGNASYFLLTQFAHKLWMLIFSIIKYLETHWKYHLKAREGCSGGKVNIALKMSLE